jgi:oxygen-independent coproporphyrinogen III oxidase
VEAYLDRLSAELGQRAERSGPFTTVYLGGGTPTVLPADRLVDLVGRLARLQQGAADPEFTIEANPGTVDAGLLGRLTEAGVGRVSLGVQSFSPGLRAALGRRVEQSEIERAVRDVGSVMTEWNLDLVFGIPGQSWQDAAADLDAAIAAGPPHISLYDLTYSALYASRVARTLGAGARGAAGAFAEEYLPSAAARLEKRGYRRYEVSNFAFPGHECRHNQAYWRGDDYIGAGAAAVSTVGLERRTNPSAVVGYLSGETPSIEVLTPRIRMWEKAMLGLRTARGVLEEEVLPVLDLVARDRLLSQGCLERRCGRLRLNPAFLDVSNTVISTLLAPAGESSPTDAVLTDDGTH